jgi:hypothetical protein
MRGQHRGKRQSSGKEGRWSTRWTEGAKSGEATEQWEGARRKGRERQGRQLKSGKEQGEKIRRGGS